MEITINITCDCGKSEEIVLIKDNGGDFSIQDSINKSLFFKAIQHSEDFIWVKCACGVGFNIYV